MPFRVLVDAHTRAVRTGRMGLPNMEVLPFTSMRIRLVCGQNDPVQGWVSIDGQDVPAPVAIYSKKAPLPFRTGYALVPFAADRVAAGVRTRLTRRGAAWTVRVDHPDGRTDRLRMDWSNREGPLLL